MTSCQIGLIRESFPSLKRTHANLPVAYFDGPGGTQVPRQVAEAMTDYLLHHNANTHWAYPTSVETDGLLANARQTVADFLNAAPDEIVFGNNMTTVTFHLARALGRGFKPGDEIIVTDLDHHANIAPWKALEKDFGIVVRHLPMNLDTFQLDLDRLPDLLSDRTRLVAVGAASNALGTISDVKTVAARARAAGALTFVDAVHYAPHNLVDVRDLGCDFLACSAYKFYGPHVGILYGRRELSETLDFPKLSPAPDTAPERAETGTQNHEGIVGTAAAVDFLASIAPDGQSRRERLVNAYAYLHETGHDLVTRLWNGLHEIDGVTVYGPPPSQPRTPTISFTLRNKPSQQVALELVEYGLFLSNGDFYASTVAERLGLSETGFVRAGAACYTTADEIDRLVDAVRRIARD